MTNAIIPSTRISTIKVRRRAVCVMAAVAAGALTWVVAVPLVGVHLVVEPAEGRAQDVGLGMVIATTLMASVAGWGLLALLERITPLRARTTWNLVAGGVLIVSLAGPLVAASDTAAVTTLMLLHLVVGLVLMIGMRHSTDGTAS